MVKSSNARPLSRHHYSTVRRAKSIRFNPHKGGPGITGQIYEASQHISAKVLARAADCSVRAAENTKQGISTLSLEHFLHAAREIPELRALALEAMGCDPASEDRERILALLVNSYSRRDK